MLLFLTSISRLSAQFQTGWVYVGGDEFNSPVLDFNKKWFIPDDRCLIGTGEIQYYTDSGNFSFIKNPIEGAYLRISTKKELVSGRAITYLPDNIKLADSLYNLRLFNYTSGAIKYQKPFKQGLFEIRCRTPYGQGFWPAFWLFGFANEEIDIFEMKGENPNGLHWALHGLGANGLRNEGGTIQFLNGNKNFTNSFNIIQCTWDNNLVQWLVNGKIVMIYNVSFLYQMRAEANTAIAGYRPGALFGPSIDTINTPFPAFFDIDYIRFWHPVVCDEVKHICNYAQTFQDPTAITGSIIYFGNNSSCNNYLVGDTLQFIHRQYLDLIGTQQVVIGPNSYIMHGSEFTASVAPCESPRLEAIPGEVGEDSVFDHIPDVPEEGRVAPHCNDQEPGITIDASVYPNPTNSVFYILNTTANLYYDVEILNLQGQVVYSKKGSEKSIIEVNLSDYPAGFYFVKLISSNKQTIKKIYLSK